ncbi:MAG: Ni/Fe hydrogenase subunit alpha [Candidatus Bathyarchaeia archaeon]
MNETVIIPQLTRLEGNAKIKIEICDGELQDLQFSVMTGPRFFEYLLLNKPAEDAPRLSERICGICYVNHHLVSVKAVEDAWGVQVPEVATLLRRTLNAASFITSHSLHLAFLALPDLMGLESRNFIGLSEEYPELGRAAIQLHEYGNKVVKEIGGRIVQVVTAIPGGQTKGLTGEARYRLLKEGRIAMRNVRTLADAALTIFEERDDNQSEYAGEETNYMGLVDEGRHEIYEGIIRARKPSGDIITEFMPQEYYEHLEETPSDHSFTKIVYLKEMGIPEGLGRVGPLGRFNVMDEMPWPTAREYLRDYRKLFGSLTDDTAAYNLARMIELVGNVDEVLEGLNDNRIISKDTRVPVETKAGEGAAAVEAPRGLLYHNYDVDEHGLIKRVNIVAPTTINHLNIENNLRSWSLDNVDMIEEKSTRDRALWSLEKIVRAYDPCLSCSVHMVDVDLIIDGKHQSKEGRA